ncbi:MAG: DNA polymerase I [Candidatus Omnitrophica bacterium CG_4_10_14_0_8_um_filter_44_12]|nr:MAG: DNA polymerase I [Candidatus Omnitrophica bacterium CG_4_10_14_0_8_um_filter_44_12]
MIDAKLCLIDANSLFYRAFFAIKSQLTTSAGQPTNAVFGFVKMVNKILGELEPQYLAVCFDVSRVTHRTEKFADYKAHRAPMPEALLSQVPFIKEVVAAYNFPVFELKGFEADDVIATITRAACKKVGKVVIISSDKDILQLVGGNVEVYNPYKEEGIVFTEEVVKQRFGVEPKRIADLIALMGDASDNIPGAKGIGEKTALELLGEYRGVEDLLKNKDTIKRETVKKIVNDNVDSIIMSKGLAELKMDVPLDITLENLKFRPADKDKLWKVFSRLEFKGMLKTLSSERLSCGQWPALDIQKKQAKCIADLPQNAAVDGVFAFFMSDEELSDTSLKVNMAFDERDVYETEDKKLLRSLFSKAGVLSVTHDVKRAKHILRRFSIEEKTGFFDTMIAAHLCESSRSNHDLESLLWDYLSLQGVSRLDYLGKESHFLFELKSKLEAALKEKELYRLFSEVEMPLLTVLFDMEEAGVSVDEKYLSRFSKEMEKRLTKLSASIFELAGCEFNINSPKQLSEVLFQKLKLPVVKKTKTGISTDEEVLTKLSQGHELPKILLEYRQISKLKATYIDALPGLIDKKTLRIHSTFNQTVTETGRLSSSDPNLQNIPIKTELGRRIRQAFIPGSGFEGLLSADYSQIELRILAHLSADEVLIEAFHKGADIHRYTASLIFGCSEKDVTDEMRENSKRVNFGIIYGMSSYGLAKDLGLDPKAAETFIAEYFLRYPKVKVFLDTQIDFVKKNGYVVTLLGRRRYIPEIANANFAVRQFAERQAINAPIQGSAADLIKLAMINIGGRLNKKGFKSRLIMQVHDELVFEFVKEEKAGLISLVRDGMENVMALSVPVKADIYIGKNWLDMQEVNERPLPKRS